MTMLQVTNLCLSLLLIASLNGCYQSHAGREMQANNNLTNAPGNHNKFDNDTLFIGTNITVNKAVEVDLPEIGVKKPDQSCLNKPDATINPKLASLRSQGNTKYFELETEESYSFGPDKFVIKIRQDLFERITLESWNKVDEFAGDTVTRRLFVLNSDKVTKLLLIGQESATSGLGHLLKTHLLLSADSGSPAVSFRSISADPLRVGITASGTTYFSQIEPADSNDMKESTKSIRLKFSLFTVAERSSTPTLETELSFICSNVSQIF